MPCFSLIRVFVPNREPAVAEGSCLAVPVRSAVARAVAGVVVGVLVLATAGCMESSHDAYIEGLRLAGDADRRECKLVYDQGAGAHVLNSAKLQDCVDANKKALAAFERAKERGLEGRELKLKLELIQDRIERLEAMRRTLRSLEMDKKLGSPLPQ